MKLSSLLDSGRAFVRTLTERSRTLWKRYRGLPRWQQALIALALIALLIAALVLATSRKPEDTVSTDRFVSLATVGELSGQGGSVDLIGTVRSVTEANILAKTGGTLTSVNARLGGTVRAGAVIASIENAAERAAVLQAEGVYDAAVAARSAQSLPETRQSARDVYQSTYTSLDTILETQVDTFFGGPTPVGPDLLIVIDREDADDLSRARDRLEDLIEGYEANLATASTRTPEALLNESETITREIQAFLNILAAAASERNAGTTAAQVSALASARSGINGALSSITAARGSLRTGTISATASADASVKQALGALRAAQANLERTVIRAPIGGTVNYLPVRVGDYVAPMQHVATVAQNGALEIVAYVSEDNRNALVAGGRVLIEDEYEGIVTSVSPALDPTTKQIEVRIAVTGTSDLVNGESVHIAIPDLAPRTQTVAEPGPMLLPLAAVKLRAGDRIVFSLGEDSRLVAHPVEVGEVRGDRIEIRSALPADLRIVADARGLAEGEKVQVASETGI